MDWKFSTKARDSIRDSNARLNVWEGSVRSGKTVSSIIRWLRYIREAPRGGELIMVGKTERTLKRNVLDVIETIVGAGQFHHSIGAGEAHILGRRVLIYGANDQRAEGKIRGLTAAGAYGDEVTLWPESFFRMLLSRLSVPGARLYATTNPDGPYHWLRTGFLDRSDLDMTTWRFRLDDNPALDPVYVASLKREYGEGTLWYRRFIDGEWVAAEGAVYAFFDESQHVLDSLDQRRPDQIDVSVDYGTSNATSVGVYGSWNRAQPGDLHAVRLAGWYHDGRITGRQKTDREVVTEVRDWLTDQSHTVRHVFVDPSAASFASELRRNGFSVRKAKNDVVDGIRTQARMLRSGEYAIMRGNGNAQAIRDYGAYLWDAKAQDRGEDRPLKQHDHTKDEERYYLHTMFGRGRIDLGAARRAAGMGA